MSGVHFKIHRYSHIGPFTIVGHVGFKCCAIYYGVFSDIRQYQYSMYCSTHRIPDQRT